MGILGRVNAGRPFGDPNGVTDTAKRLGLEWTMPPWEDRRNEHRLAEAVSNP